MSEMMLTIGDALLSLPPEMQLAWVRDPVPTSVASLYAQLCEEGVGAVLPIYPATGLDGPVFTVRLRDRAEIWCHLPEPSPVYVELDPVQHRFALRLAHARRARGHKQKELAAMAAEACGVPLDIAAMESGSAAPRLDEVSDLALVLKVAPAWLAGWAHDGGVAAIGKLSD